tara:strand:- start:1038 stop:1469 length:432 start_codon:yes stop_codon:yes gene_type:complete
MKRIYNKNAREKALLEEAYGSVYERTLDPYDKQGEEPAPEVMLNPRDEEDEDDFFAWHDRKKKFLGKRGDVVKDSVTGDKGVIVNVRDYKVDLRNGEREWTAKIRDLVLDEEEEGEGDENIDVTGGGGTDAGEFEAEDKTGYG